MDYGRESWWLRLSNDYFQLTRKCEEKKREKEREREREANYSSYRDDDVADEVKNGEEVWEQRLHCS